MEDRVFLREQVIEFCKRYEYPQEAIELFVECFDKIVDDDSLSLEFFSPIVQYSCENKVNIKKYVGKGGKLSKIAKRLCYSQYTVDFLFCLCLTPYLKERYAKEGVEESIYYDSMLDLKCKLFECKRVYGVWGSFVAKWLARWFDMALFGIKRLQFEPKKRCFLRGDFGGKKVKLFQPYVMVHIPSAGRLLYEEVRESYIKAHNFFEKHGYDKDVVFVLASWLLNPDHEQFLSTESNIIRFSHDYKRIFSIPMGKSDFWRIFGEKYHGKKSKMPEKTTLQKGYASLIRKGKGIKVGIGAFVFDGKNVYK